MSLKIFVLQFNKSKFSHWFKSLLHMNNKFIQNVVQQSSWRNFWFLTSTILLWWFRNTIPTPAVKFFNLVLLENTPWNIKQTFLKKLKIKSQYNSIYFQKTANKNLNQMSSRIAMTPLACDNSETLQSLEFSRMVENSFEISATLTEKIETCQDE